MRGTCQEHPKGKHECEHENVIEVIHMGSKSPDQDVIATLETIAQETIETTGFFHSGPEPYVNVMRDDKSNR